jgi:hypothetical protein
LVSLVFIVSVVSLWVVVAYRQPSETNIRNKFQKCNKKKKNFFRLSQSVAKPSEFRTSERSRLDRVPKRRTVRNVEALRIANMKPTHTRTRRHTYARTRVGVHTRARTQARTGTHALTRAHRRTRA